MKKYLFPLAFLAFSGCGAVHDMNCMINESTRAIRGNCEAVEMSTRAIRRNLQAIEESNRAIEENRRQLDEINGSLQEMNEHEKSS